MRHWIFAALVAFAVVSPAVRAQSVGGTPFLAVHGVAEVDVVPDIFPVSVEIAVTGMDVGKSQSEVEALTRRALDAGRALKLADADIRVGEMSISPREEYDAATRKQVFRGNRYSRSLELRFRRLSDVKAFVAALPAGESLRVSTQEFASSVANETRRKLLVDAIDDARRTAEVLAAGIGRKVGVAQTISTSPMALSAGSYINAIDVADVEATSILTAEQIARIPVPRSITSVALLSPGTVRSQIVLEAGSVRLRSDVYVLYLLRD